MRTELPRLEADAIELIDENNAMQGYAAVVNVYHSDTPGDMIIAKERYADEASARQAAAALRDREWARVLALYGVEA